MAHDGIRHSCCLANRQLPATGLVDLTFGNVSVFDPAAGVFAIKPSGVDYAALTPASMVIVDLDGRLVEGPLRPSSDTPTHRCLYREWGQRGILSVAHTHSRTATAFAQAGREIPCLGTTHADFFHGPVPLTRALTPEEVREGYEWATGSAIVERFTEIDPRDIPAVLVRHHGPFAWGPTADGAVENALALEIAADLALKTLALDPAAPPVPSPLRQKHFLRKHGPGATYGQH